MSRKNQAYRPLAVFLCVGCLLIAPAWSGSEHTYSPPNVRFDVLIQPDIPVNVANLAVWNDPGRQVSRFDYTLRNDTGAELRNVTILVIFFNDRGEPLGADYFRRKVNLTVNEEQKLHTFLKHYVDNSQRVVLAVVGFENSVRAWRVEHAPVIAAMKQKALQLQ